MAGAQCFPGAQAAVPRSQEAFQDSVPRGAASGEVGSYRRCGGSINCRVFCREIELHQRQAQRYAKSLAADTWSGWSIGVRDV
mmetsp:Transcript_4950/g.12089  ORF Transcript_4950/g.12089 Transcript_4950/m.12089 type:complete len:83 (-) Transcript_4950:456-704(-)